MGSCDDNYEHNIKILQIRRIKRNYDLFRSLQLQKINPWSDYLKDDLIQANYKMACQEILKNNPILDESMFRTKMRWSAGCDKANNFDELGLEYHDLEIYIEYV